MSCRQAYGRARRRANFAEAARPGDQQIAPFGDPVAGGELQEQSPVEPACALIVHILDAGRMAQASGAGARLEALLTTQRQLVFEQQAEPFGVLEASGLGLVLEFLEPFGKAIETERVQ
ncbi:hypothetical+protein [Methylocapsa aurea]